MKPVAYGDTGTDPIQQLAKTAAQTGGGLYRLSDYTDLRRVG